MSIRLGENNYGKQCVRLLRLSQQDGRHDIKELTLGIRFEGNFDTAHTKGDNRGILPTDTMKNIVYALARQHPIETAEAFCLLLTEHFLPRNPQVSRIHVEATETLWTRLPVGEQSHAYTFTCSTGEKRTAAVSATRNEKTVRAGIEGLVILKATQSEFKGFLRVEKPPVKKSGNVFFPR